MERPLRRPWWFFDVRVQGNGAVDIPTHLVDQTQWLLEGWSTAPTEIPQLVSARAWPTRVPAAMFRTITGQAGFPPELQPLVDGDALSYLCNAELDYRLGGVSARAGARWDLSPPPGGGDTHRTVARGTRADAALEQGAHTGNRRRLFIEPRGDTDRVTRALTETIAGWQSEAPGAGVSPAGPRRYEITIPAALDGGHETHFAQVLDEFLRAIDGGRWPDALAGRTLAKYTLLAEAAAATGVSTPGDSDASRPGT